LFDLSGITAVFTYPENVAGIEQYLSEQVGYLATPEDVDLTNKDSRIEDGELAVLQHSSGTTSLKKGVMLSHAAILDQVRSYSAVLGFDSRSRIVSWLPLYHDMGFIACFLMPMIMGSPVSHIDAFAWSAKPTLLLDEIEAFRGEYVWMPNFAYNHIANSVRPNRQWDLRSLKALINCSEPCKPSTFETFRSISEIRNLSANALQVCYAMAENVFAVSQTDLHAMPRVISVSNHSFREGDRIEIVDDEEADGVEILSCGKVIDGTVVRIIDQNDFPYFEEGRVGEIAITGSSLYTGYYKRPKVTAERLVDGWHRTGDVGFIHQGELFVTGRVDDLLIVRGKNIYAHEVEDAVNALGVVNSGRAVAFTTYSPDKGEAELVVLAESDNQEAELAVRKIVRRAVESSFGVPLAHFRLFPPRTLRKTTSGKLSRKDNLELYQGLQ
jgi:acyl-CoA synthetase (AMP-forming)/AMP-acid ligase II